MLFYCNLYVDMRRWNEKMDAQHVVVHDAIKGNECIVKETMLYLGIV